MHFGPLRSMLHNSEPSQVAFDEVMRHLLNVTWWDEPRIVEECLAYTNAAMARWPDATRTLHVTSQEVMFLDHVFLWGLLLRNLELDRTPEFLQKVTRALQEGDLLSLRFISFYHCRLTREISRLIGEHVHELEGFAVRNEVRDETLAFADLFPAANALKYLVMRGEWDLGDIFRSGTPCESLVYLDAPILDLNRWELVEELFPNLETLAMHDPQIDEAAVMHIIENATFEHLNIVGIDSFYEAPRTTLREAIRARGWRNDESKVRFTTRWHSLTQS